MRTYTIQIPPTLVTVAGGARTLLQVTAGAVRSIRLLSAFLGQSGTTTNQQVRVRILRKTVSATVTAFTPAPMEPGDSAFTGTSGNNASAEGTDGTVLAEDVWSALSGWVYKPIPEEFIGAPGAGILAIKIPVALTADLTIEGYMTVEELG